MRPQRIQAGDTIIEVMLAMALLTAFLFISWGITNKATQIGLNSQKRIEMVNTMKEQAEILKAQYAIHTYDTSELVPKTVSLSDATHDFSGNPCESKPSGNKQFYYAYSNNTEQPVQQQVGSAKLVPDGENTVWIQVVPAIGKTPAYYDFYVRACWQTVGSAQNTDSSQFVVRLNTNAP